MHALAAFAVSLAFITVIGIRYRIMPFISLIAASLLYGLLAGMDPGTVVDAIARGLGSVFSLLAVVIFCGSVIAQVLRQGGYLERIVADIQRISHRPLQASAVSGYLLSVPLMCSITSFVILAPVVSRLQGGEAPSRHALYLAAIGGVVSFALLYPSPVVFSIVSILGIHPESPWTIDCLTLPLSLVLLAAIVVLWGGRRKSPQGEPRTPPSVSSLRAWSPIGVPVLFFLVGSLAPPLRLLADVNLALLAGLAAALLVAGEDLRLDAVSSGTKNAGVIIFDLTAAGALGATIAASDFPAQAYGVFSGVLPPVFIPFVLAALVQTAQGSRVTTAVVTAGMVSATPVAAAVHPFALLLMICAGTCTFSYVSDPFFWLMQRITADPFPAVVRRFTLPLALVGLAVLAAALVVDLVA